MSTDFVVRVYAVVLALARKLFRADEHRVQDALGNAWYLYQQTDRRLEITATAFAWAAVRWVLSGRDIPGTGRSGRRSDALDRPGPWQGGGMGLVKDKGPGPERIAVYRELLELALELEGSDAVVVQGFLQGLQAKEVARRLGVTPSSVTQRRQRIARDLDG